MPFPHLRYYDPATHWTTTPGRYGDYSFSTPANYTVRWEDKTELFNDANGRQDFSRAIVYSEEDFALDDFLVNFETTAADPTTDSATKELVRRVRRIDKIPSVDGQKVHKKYYLV